MIPNAPHLEHVDSPSPEYVPLWQPSHADAREPEDRPAAHLSHEAWPVRLRLNVPLTHSEHDAVEGAAAYVPLAHGEQVLAPEPLYVPARQAVQLIDSAALHVPDSQVSQTDAPNVTPVELPPPHVVQLAWPVAGW